MSNKIICNYLFFNDNIQYTLEKKNEEETIKHFSSGQNNNKFQDNFCMRRREEQA